MYPAASSIATTCFASAPVTFSALRTKGASNVASMLACFTNASTASAGIWGSAAESGTRVLSGVVGLCERVAELRYLRRRAHRDAHPVRPHRPSAPDVDVLRGHG